VGRGGASSPLAVSQGMLRCWVALLEAAPSSEALGGAAEPPPKLEHLKPS